MIDPVQRVLDQFDVAGELADAFGCGSKPGSWCADHWSMGVIVRNTRLFMVGDIVLVFFNNGNGERWPVFGLSSKGYRVSYKYVQGFRYSRHDECTPTCVVRCPPTQRYTNRTALRFVEVPDEVWSQRGSKSDPAVVRQWLSDALRAGYAASGVGSGSPALFLPFERE